MTSNYELLFKSISVYDYLEIKITVEIIVLTNNAKHESIPCFQFFLILNNPVVFNTFTYVFFFFFGELICYP